MSQTFMNLLKRTARPFLSKGYFNAPILRPIANWYYRKYRPEYVMIEGSRFYLDYSDGWFSSYVAVHGYWEKVETALVRQYVKPGMTVLDLGANIGYYTLLLSGLVGETGSVVAYEPEIKCLERLNRNISGLKYKNVRLRNRAAWDAECELDFYINPTDTMDHTASPIRSHFSSYKVTAERVDSLFAETAFDFVKMDIQGAEGRALEGMQKTLGHHRPAVIMAEFWPAALKMSGTDPQVMFNRLKDLGYSIFAMREDRQSVTPMTYQQVVETFAKDYEFTNLLCLQPGMPFPVL